MRGWLEKNGSLHLCQNPQEFASARNMTEEDMMRWGWIKLDNNKWTGADLNYTTPEQANTMRRFRQSYGVPMPTTVRQLYVQHVRGYSRMAAA